VDGSKGFGPDLDEPVVPPDVRKLVPEHDADAIVVPLPRVRREEHARPEQPPRRQQVGSIGVKDRDPAREPMSRRDFARDPCPSAALYVLYGLGA
jgi:hypothetical protein